MKMLQDTKIKLGGSILVIVASALIFSLGTVFGIRLSNTKYDNEYFLLPKEYYDCWVGMLLPDEQQTRVCVVYRAKGINFEGNNLPRHREYNKEQGKRIHEF